MSWFVFLPIALPFAGFCLTLLCFRHIGLQKMASIAIALLYLIFSLNLAFFDPMPEAYKLHMGGWPSPFAISLSIDKLSALMIAVTSLIFFILSLYSVPGQNAENSPLYFPLLNALIVGISGAFVTADLFNLYVWFEVTLLASFVLCALEKTERRLAGALKYVTLNILSSIFFLLAAGLIYNAAHTLDFVDLKIQLAVLARQDTWYVVTLAALLFAGFAIKSALFPLYGWLPASYHHLSPAISAIFAGMLTKVGLYAIFRVSLGLFPSQNYLVELILWVGPLTMIFGVLGAIAQNNIRRILSFHIISQVGYIVVAGVFVCAEDPVLRTTGFAAAVFYMIHHILVKTNLFMVSGLIRERQASEDISRVGGLRQAYPLLAIGFAIPALSLAGIPPSSGFWAKFALLKASLTAGYFWATAAMILAGFFTVFSMVKIWNGVFWAPKPEGVVGQAPRSRLPLVAVLLLATISLALGFYPELLMKAAMQASEQMQTAAVSTGSSAWLP